MNKLLNWLQANGPVLVVGLALFIPGYMGGSIAWDLSERKALIAAYNDCLRTMTGWRGTDVQLVDMFCRRLREKL